MEPKQTWQVYSRDHSPGINRAQSAILALSAKKRPFRSIFLKLLFLSYSWKKPDQIGQVYSWGHSADINWAQSEIMALWADKRPSRPILKKTAICWLFVNGTEPNLTGIF